MSSTMSHVAQIVHYREAELGPLIIGNPQARNLMFALGWERPGSRKPPCF